MVGLFILFKYYFITLVVTTPNAFFPKLLSLWAVFVVMVMMKHPCKGFESSRVNDYCVILVLVCLCRISCDQRSTANAPQL